MSAVTPEIPTTKSEWTANAPEDAISNGIIGEEYIQDERENVEAIYSYPHPSGEADFWIIGYENGKFSTVMYNDDECGTFEKCVACIQRNY